LNEDHMYVIVPLMDLFCFTILFRV